MLPLEELTVGQLLRRTARRLPERPAMEYGDRTWSYREFDAQVDLWARRLLGLGIRKGERVGLWCETEPRAVFLMYALVRIGAVCAMFNTSLRRPELRSLLERTRISTLLYGGGYKELDYPEICRGLEEELPCLERMYYVSEAPRSGYPALEEILPATPAELEWAEEVVRPEDTAFILYTSGTTSAPKAVMGSHFSRANSGVLQAHDLGATQDDRFCVGMPMFHCFCLSVNILAASAVGACLCLPAGRRTGELLETITRRRCTVFSSVPALFHAILCREDFDRWDLSCLRTGFIGGSLYPAALFREIDERFGENFTLLSSLGQTEATAGLTTSFLGDTLEVRSETVGHFMDHVEGKIADIETGAALPPGRSGEICVRGYLVMQGYYGQGEETARAIDPEGWLHTGDMGCMDEKGNIRMTGRLKELIIRGGENISPAEVENVAAEWPNISMCKAVGVPDGHYGEEICLCVIPRERGDWDEEAFREWLRPRLAAFKLPRYILLLEEFPRTVTGKIRPAELRALAVERLGLDR